MKSLSTGRWAGIITASVLSHAAVVHAAEKLRIELKPEAFVNGPYVTLGDIATISGGDAELKHAVEEIRVARAPEAGYTGRASREELDRLVRSLMAPREVRIGWDGARNARFASAMQMVEGSALADAARRYLEKELANRFDELRIEPVSRVADLPVPAGTLEIKPRGVDLKRPFSNMPVWMDVYVNGEIYRPALVPMAIAAMRMVYVAKRDLREGELVTGEDFEWKKETVTDMSIEPAGPTELYSPVRMKKPIFAGQMLAKSSLAGQSEIFRGDEVTLVADEGGFRIETRAVAQNDSALGKSIRVRPEQGTGTVMGWVVSPGVVRLNGE